MRELNEKQLDERRKQEPSGIQPRKGYPRQNIVPRIERSRQNKKYGKNNPRLQVMEKNALAQNESAARMQPMTNLIDLKRISFFILIALQKSRNNIFN